MTPQLPWPEFWEALVGVVLGFFLAQGWEGWQRHRRSKGHWAALRAEIHFCREAAETYERPPLVKAPLYRLPTTTYAHSFPVLLADAAVVETQASSLIRFFSEVETFNRGLDLADAARDEPEKLDAEFGRNLLKFANIKKHYSAAIAAVEAHL